MICDVTEVKVKVGKSLHKLNFPVLTSSFRPLFDLPDAPSAVPPTSSEWVPGRPVPKPWRFYKAFPKELAWIGAEPVSYAAFVLTKFRHGRNRTCALSEGLDTSSSAFKEGLS